MDWQLISDQYANQYEETVYVVLEDKKTKQRQTIVSNKIHPYFVNLTEDLQASENESNASLTSSEGHSYKGSIKNGYWVDASELKAGYRLLNNDETWSVVMMSALRKSH